MCGNGFVVKRGFAQTLEDIKVVHKPFKHTLHIGNPAFCIASGKRSCPFMPVQTGNQEWIRIRKIHQCRVKIVPEAVESFSFLIGNQFMDDIIK